MSIPVALETLRTAIAERGSSAYLLTVTPDAHPHAVHLHLEWADGTLVGEVGKGSAANCAAHPAVSLLYPVRQEGDSSLIVDGEATVEPHAGGQRVRIAPAKAILHRPAAAPKPDSSCTADCVPLLRS